MARIRPFAGWRYDLGTDVSGVTAPPYDVISPEQRAELIAKHPNNVVALELPEGPLDPSIEDNRYEVGRRTWEDWRNQGVLAHDPSPAIYVLEQTFSLGDRSISRKAFIVEVGLEPFDAGVVLPHERTLPKALGDRFELIKATAANFSQVLGLYDDPDCATDEVFEAAMSGDPVETAVDDDGVVSRLWAATDASIACRLSGLLRDARIFIADGHHRYTTALAYRDLRREQAREGGSTAVDPDYDYVMMALVNMDDPELVVLPTHRVADADGDFDANRFREGLLEYFTVEDLAPGHPSRALDASEGPAFLVKTRYAERPSLVRLRPDVDLNVAIPLPCSQAWKHLDVAVLQELILNPLLGIHPDRPETLERLSFVKDPHHALSATAEHDVAFVLRATRMEQLSAVALAGETMPQKSTYFYPKLLSGMVFRSAE